MYELTGEPLPHLLGRSCGVGAVVPRGGTNGRSSSESLWLGGVSEPLLLLASFLFSSSISLSFQPGIPLVQLPAGKTFANAGCTSPFAFRGHSSFTQLQGPPKGFCLQKYSLLLSESLTFRIHASSRTTCTYIPDLTLIPKLYLY